MLFKCIWNIDQGRPFTKRVHMEHKDVWNVYPGACGSLLYAGT